MHRPGDVGDGLMVSYSVSIPNLPQLQAAFKRLPEITSRALTSAINESLVGYQATAKQLAPISSGRLRSSILISPARFSRTPTSH